MKAYRARFPLAAMCRVLGLSTSGYYGWLTRPPSARRRRDIELQGKILLIWGRQRGDLWLPSDPRGTASGGRAGEPEARGAPDEGFGHSGRDAKALQDGDDEEGREGPARARPGEPQLLGRRARPAVGRRHHAGAHLGGLAVPRSRARCLEPPHRRLGDGAAHAGRAGGGCAGDGGLEPEAQGAGGASLRQGLAG